MRWTKKETKKSKPVTEQATTLDTTVPVTVVDESLAITLSKQLKEHAQYLDARFFQEINELIIKLKTPDCNDALQSIKIKAMDLSQCQDYARLLIDQNVLSGKAQQAKQQQEEALAKQKRKELHAFETSLTTVSNTILLLKNALRTLETVTDSALRNEYTQMLVRLTNINDRNNSADPYPPEEYSTVIREVQKITSDYRVANLWDNVCLKQLEAVNGYVLNVNHQLDNLKEQNSKILALASRQQFQGLLPADFLEKTQALSAKLSQLTTTEPVRIPDRDGLKLDDPMVNSYNTLALYEKPLLATRDQVKATEQEIAKLAAEQAALNEEVIAELSRQATTQHDSQNPADELVQELKNIQKEITDIRDGCTKSFWDFLGNRAANKALVREEANAALAAIQGSLAALTGNSSQISADDISRLSQVIPADKDKLQSCCFFSNAAAMGQKLDLINQSTSKINGLQTKASKKLNAKARRQAQAKNAGDALAEVHGVISSRR